MATRVNQVVPMSALKAAAPIVSDDDRSFMVYGVRYQMELFRMMAQTPRGCGIRWIFELRDDGHMEVTMETLNAS